MNSDIVGFHFHRDLYADVERRRVLRDGTPIKEPLAPMEFAVLEFFLRHPHELIESTKVTPLNEFSREYSRVPLDDYVAKINRKLGLRDEDKGIFVRTRRVGMTLETAVRPVYASDRQEGVEIFKASEFNFNFHTVELLRASLQQSLKALELNPHGLPMAHVTVAYDYINLSQSAYAAEVPETVLPEARVHALEAIKHKASEAAGRGVLGLVDLIYDYNWEKAEDEFDRAFELDPDEPATLLSYAHLYVTSGKFAEAIEAVERASRLTPDDRIIYASWGWIQLLAGNVEEAIRLSKHALFLHPGFPPAHIMLGWAYEANRQYDLALKEYESSLRAEYSPAALASLGHLYGKTGRTDKALAMLDELQVLHERGSIKYVPAYCRALIYAGLKQTNKCLSELERAFDQHCDWLIHLVLERRWDAVRNTMRFKRLVTRVGIPYLG